MGTTLDTNGKIFGVVASVHILLVCIFSLLTTGKCLPPFASFSSQFYRSSFSHRQDNFLVKEED